MNEPSNPYPNAGEILDGKYRVEKLLGEGGMGAVARATHLLLHRTVAVKFMNPQFMSFPGAVERFLNEGRASGAIKSDHVVPVSDVGCLPTGVPYLVMECLYGLDLADLLARDGPSGLPVQRAVHFVLQILRGLQSAHAIGIIHRDMKPSNCFVVNHDGEDDFIKILDFGISKIQQPGSASLTQTNSALGTPLYMSPEQARSPRDVDQRSDLYSVGVILYELLSGHTPFFSESGEFTEILFQLFTADPPPIQQTRPDLSDELAAVVHKALAREVQDRYSTAVELAEALLPFAAEGSHEIVEKMRAYKPPTKDSFAPVDGLPTSLAAFSQLQRGAGTDLMANRPTTDVQRGAPVTEILMPEPTAAPRQAKTAVLPGQPSNEPRVSAVPELFAARSTDALGKTQLELPPGAQTGASARTGAGVQTDLGASRDAAPATPAESGRSPLMFLVPVAGVALIGGVVLVLALGKGSDPARKDPVANANFPPPPAVVSLAPPPAASNAPAPVASEPAPATLGSAAPPPSASVSAKPATTAPRPGPKHDPGLDQGIHF